MNFSQVIFHFPGDIIVVRYEAGANGYRVLPITKKEFAEVMQAANRPKTTFASKHPRPQPIFPKSKEESRSPKLRTEESLHPKSAIPAPYLETSSSKKYEKTLENSGREENPSPIIPAFLRPKVSNYRNCRLNCSEELCDTNLSLLRYGITDFW